METHISLPVEQFLKADSGTVPEIAAVRPGCTNDHYRLHA